MKQLYLLLITLLVSLSAYAEKSGTCGDNLQWKLTDEGVLTITGTGEMNNWKDWEDNNYSPWRADKSVKQVIIGDGVTTIGDNAFFSCSSLTSVTIPNSVTTIGGSAFSSCSSLTSVTIPNGINTIESGTFSSCSSLTSVTIPNSVTTIGSSAFSFCSSLTSVNIPNSVKTIGKWAFYGCSSLASVTIGNGVTTIGRGAFKDCSSITSVTIGKSVTSIADDAFGYTSGSKVIWLTNTPPSGYSGVGGSIHYVPNTSYSRLSDTKVYPSLNSIFEVGGIKYVPVSLSERTCDAIDCIYTEDANEINIDKKVNYKGFDMAVRDINPYTFSRNKYIKKANIDITGSIGEWAFDGCSSLKYVTIGNSVKTIGSAAFSGCSSLTSVTIPNSVTTIGGNAFDGCSSLTSVTIGNSVTTIGSYAFDGCSSLTSVTIPNSVTTIGETAFRGCSSLTSVTIGNSVRTIDYKAFSGCRFLTSVTIGNGVTRIGDYAFDGCIRLVRISCDAELPPSCSTNLFYPINPWKCKLIVPKNSIDAYKKADGWRYLFLIEGTTTGIINNIYNKIDNVDVYTIDGIKRLSKANVNEINALPKGVYIINGKKIVIK